MGKRTGIAFGAVAILLAGAGLIGRAMGTDASGSAPATAASPVSTAPVFSAPVSSAPVAGPPVAETTGVVGSEPGAVEAPRSPSLSLLDPTESVDPAAVEAAHQERIDNFPPAQPIDPNATWITGQQAVDAARLFAQSSDPAAVLPPVERAALPATAVLVRYEELVDAFLGGSAGGDPDIATDRPVWVVVVHGIIRNDSMMAGESVEAATHQVFTVVYDAPTGELILLSSGGDAFGAGLRPVSTVEHSW